MKVALPSCHASRIICRFAPQPTIQPIGLHSLTTFTGIGWHTFGSCRVRRALARLETIATVNCCVRTQANIGKRRLQNMELLLFKQHLTAADAVVAIASASTTFSVHGDSCQVRAHSSARQGNNGSVFIFILLGFFGDNGNRSALTTAQTIRRHWT